MKYPLTSRGLFGSKYLDIQERTREMAAPEEDHVLVKVRACGVCGTDVNFVRDWQDDPSAPGPRDRRRGRRGREERARA